MTTTARTTTSGSRASHWLRTSRSLLLVGLIPAAMVLSACGGDDDDTSSSSPTMGAASQTTATSGMAMGTATTGMDMGTATMGMDMGTPTMGSEASPTMPMPMATATTGMDTASPTADASPVAEMVTSDTGAAALRTVLTVLLQEHVYLAGAATGAAIGGRADEFDAAAATLDMNSVQLSEAIGSIYGDDAGDAFLDLWRNHITMFVTYTQAAATGDEAGKADAQADLEAYGLTFGEFMESANPNLPAEAVAAELAPHVATLLAAIDAQVAVDPMAFELLREAAMHMPMTAAVLANGIATQMPEMFDGSSEAPASSLRAYLNTMFSEHVYLAGAASGAALDGRSDDFEAAAAQLDANSVELSASFGEVYGAEAGEAFLEQWRAHIVLLVDYVTATAGADTAGQEAAVNGLVAYVGTFATFMSDATGIPQEALASLLEDHVLGLKDMVDLQAAGDLTGAYAAMQLAAMHMQMIADPFAEATVQMFPDLFTE